MKRISLVLATVLLASPAAVASAAEQSQERSARRSSAASMRRAHTASGSGPHARQPRRAAAGTAGTNVRMNQDSGNGPQNEISIAVDPTNASNIAGGANDYRSGVGESGFYASTDGGATWVDGILPMPAGVDSAGDPVLRFDATGAKLYYAQLAFESSGALGGCDSSSGVYVSTATAHGTSWAAGAKVAANSATVFNDKPWLAVDRSSGIAGKSGNVYLAYTKFTYASPLDCQTGVETTNSPIKLRRSTNGGQTWSAEIDVSGSNLASQGAAVAVAPNGTVSIAYESFSGCVDCIMVARSTDGGQTFTRTRVADISGIDTLPAGGGATFRGDSFPALAVDGNGRAYVVWSEFRDGAATSDVWISWSDNGTTWTDPLRVNPEVAGDQFFPGIAAGGNGKVFVSYSDRHDDPDNVLYLQYVSHSHDGGASWSATQVADEFSDPNAVTFDGDLFVGDYNGIDILPGASGVWTGWCDTRRSTQGSGQQDAYAARVDVAETVSAITASSSPAIAVWGTTFTVSGRLTGDGAPAQGKTISIQQRPFGASAWTQVSTATTISDGTFTGSAGKPSKHTDLRAVFAGDDELGGSTSARMLAQVRPGVIFFVADSTLFRGQAASFSGRVLPEHPGKKVMLQQLTNSGWVTIQTVTLDARSNFRASARLAARGFRLYRVAYPTQDLDHAWNISRNLGVTWS